MTEPMSERFPILYTGFNRVMVVLGLRPANSYVDVTDRDVTVKMGWAFRATIDRSTIRSVEDDHDPVWGWGAHGWRGRWLVNGSSSNIVRVEIDPPAPARTAGFPVKLRTLRVSLEDPERFTTALDG